MVRTKGFFTGRCSLNRQLNGQRYRQESNLLLPGCSRLPHHLAPVSFVSVPAWNRTWATSFAGSCAIRHTPRTCCLAVPRQGVEPRLVVPKTTVRPSHSQGMFQVSRPGLEPGPEPSEGSMLSATPSGRRADDWIRTSIIPLTRRTPFYFEPRRHINAPGPKAGNEINSTSPTRRSSTPR